MTKIYTSSPVLVSSAININVTGKNFTSTYIELEFSSNIDFKPSHLVVPTGGTVLIEGSIQGTLWGKASTSAGNGTISLVVGGDYERVSMDGIIEKLKLSPTSITGATYWRVIISKI